MGSYTYFKGLVAHEDVALERKAELAAIEEMRVRLRMLAV